MVAIPHGTVPPMHFSSHHVSSHRIIPRISPLNPPPASLLESPPSQSLRPSQCSESEQLETLSAYIKSVEDELQQHNQLRSPMLLAFTPRGHNAAKAMTNWERKSSYLLREIVKFRTYVDSLQRASERRSEVYVERDNARRAARGEEIDDSSSTHSDEADMTLKAES
ncbi:hypothetical protein NUW58_g10087 [Xylaria curta]|uniref:Uncharacterized protein n=1 Tax=Xylaria curta TaxID=42375 RepID=A0ACC1MQE0_9PEZI|nr:hypothetical protein NUW58_g10087 [Xylaria curta]